MTTTQPYAKPIPMITPENEPYWQACKQHELRLPTCASCGPHFYPRSFCPTCGSRDLEWRQMSGRGAVYTYAIVRRAPTPGFRGDVPYITAIVELEEGPRMMTNVVGVAAEPEAITVGMPVEVTFEDITDEISLPKFRPRAERPQ